MGDGGSMGDGWVMIVRAFRRKTDAEENEW